MTRLLTPTATVVVAGETVVPDSGYVRLDETDIYATCAYSIPLLSDEWVELIDPRTGIRTLVTLNGRAFDLGVRERTANHAEKTVTITAASDEALLEDYTPLADDTTPVSMASSVRAVVNYVLGIVIPGAALQTTPSSDAAVAEADALTWKAGTSAWGFLVTLTAAAGLRLFCDEQRKWRLVPASYAVRGSVTATPSTSREADDTISRDGESWVTGVIVRYRWTTDDNEAHERIDAAGLPGKVNVLDIDGPYPGPGVASARLNRLRGQGRSQTANAFATYTETPGMEARLVLPGAPTQIGRVQTVEWELLDGFVEITTRELTEAGPTAWIFLPAGESWDDSPVGASWIDEGV